MSSTCTHDRVTFVGGSYCTECATFTPPGGPGLRYDWWRNLDGSANLETLALVAHHMAVEGDSPQAVAYLLEKPWKYSDEFAAAVRACAPPAAIRTLLAVDPSEASHGVTLVPSLNYRRKDYTMQFTASEGELRRILGLPPTD